MCIDPYPDLGFMANSGPDSSVLRIRDVYHGSRILFFYPFRIPDPKTATKERGEKKFVVKPFL
jgi:hypothetical protein